MASGSLWLARTGLTCRIGSGVVAGLAGGIVFGFIMHTTGALVMVARLVDGQTLFVGWAVHLAISAFVGITFGLLAGDAPWPVAWSIAFGTAYGWLWWVLGGLTLMPLRLGTGLFVFNADAWKSLAGHLAYGLVLGAAYGAVRPARPAGRDQTGGSEHPPRQVEDSFRHRRR